MNIDGSKFEKCLENRLHAPVPVRSLTKDSLALEPSREQNPADTYHLPRRPKSLLGPFPMNGTRRKRTSSSTSPSVPDASLSAKILQAQDDERRRISRELHDSVGQSLTAAKLALGKLKRQFASEDLDEVENRVDEALKEVRTLSHLLHPLMLDVMGLRSSILSYAEGYEQRTGIKTSIVIPEPLPKFNDITTTALFRIVQECLTNVHKHANASSITIRVDIGEQEFRLEVTDNGVGFATYACEGVGIRGMGERLKELGGTLELLSEPNLGSSVVATIPLNWGNLL